jgi:acyl-CoA synthetase (AMP-forming)/AMP-acid ligase II
MKGVPNAKLAQANGGPLDVDGFQWPSRYPCVGKPEKPALIFRDTVLTYRELEDLTAKSAALFRRLGFGRGTRVAYLGKNSEIYFPILFGAMRAGTVLVPLNWRCTSHELEYIITEAEATLLICDKELEQLARAAAPRAAIITIEGEGGFKDELTREQPASDWLIEPDAPAVLMFTSGTTGKPKGVVITERMFGLARQAEMTSRDYASWRQEDVILSPMPNFHMAACSWVQCAIMRGLTCVITDDPSPGNLLSLSTHHNVTHIFIVPTVVRALIDLLQADNVSLPSLREIHYGAAPMDLELLERSMHLLGCGFVHHYGMTENAGTATRLGPEDHDPSRPHLLRSVGRPQPGMIVEIRRQDLKVARCGEAGEIWLRSETIMPGYWRRPEATDETIIDGWYRTGDGGYLDEEGYLYLTDRIKDLIVSGGENVYPVEIECVLRLHPDVAEVVVFGQPDERWGEAVIAAIELQKDAIPDEDSLRTHCRKQLAGFKVPKRFVFDLVLPRTATGKLQRSVARSEFLSAQALV